MFITQANGAVNTATIRPDGKGLVRVTNYGSDGRFAYGNSYSPDGRWILLRLEVDGEYALYEVHPDGSDLTAVTQFSSSARAEWRGDRRSPTRVGHGATRP